MATDAPDEGIGIRVFEIFEDGTERLFARAPIPRTTKDSTSEEWARDTTGGYVFKHVYKAKMAEGAAAPMPCNGVIRLSGLETHEGELQTRFSLPTVICKAFTTQGNDGEILDLDSAGNVDISELEEKVKIEGCWRKDTDAPVVLRVIVKRTKSDWKEFHRPVTGEVYAYRPVSFEVWEM